MLHVSILGLSIMSQPTALNTFSSVLFSILVLWQILIETSPLQATQPSKGNTSRASEVTAEHPGDGLFQGDSQKPTASLPSESSEKLIKNLDENFTDADIEPKTPTNVEKSVKNITIFNEDSPDVISKNNPPLKPVAEDKDPTKTQLVTLRALDKITGRSIQLVVQIDEMKTFGKLRIVVHRCKTSAPTDPPEASAFLKIYEYLPEKTMPPVLHYSGWMFASSPTVGALTHPVYDVWVEGCRFVDKNTLPKVLPAPETLTRESLLRNTTPKTEGSAHAGAGSTGTYQHNNEKNKIFDED